MLGGPKPGLILGVPVTSSISGEEMHTKVIVGVEYVVLPTISQIGPSMWVGRADWPPTQ